jgi:glucokinase
MTRLIADIGGTNARFALVGADGLPAGERHLLVRDFPDLAAAADAYLGGRRAEEAVIAVATPVESDRISFTNSPWTFSIAALRERLGFRELAVINDFVAQALATPHLGPGELEPIGGGGAPVPGRAVGVIGPGTGLGVSALIPGKAGWTELPSEGGHASFAPGNAREARVLEELRGRFGSGHVSNERVVSGQGLLNLAQALAAIDGRRCPAATPEDVTEGARAGGCPSCREAIELFSATLGAAAGDLALLVGARGGVFVAGGVCQKLGPLFDRAAFRERFAAKGRLRPYLEAIPTWLVLRADTGLLGAARYRMPA